MAIQARMRPGVVDTGMCHVVGLRQKWRMTLKTFEGACLLEVAPAPWTWYCLLRASLWMRKCFTFALNIFITIVVRRTFEFNGTFILLKKIHIEIARLLSNSESVNFPKVRLNVRTELEKQRIFLVATSTNEREFIFGYTENLPNLNALFGFRLR